MKTDYNTANKYPIGIGTTNPNSSYKLDVVGNINITGNYYLNGSNLSYADLTKKIIFNGYGVFSTSESNGQVTITGTPLWKEKSLSRTYQEFTVTKSNIYTIGGNSQSEKKTILINPSPLDEKTIEDVFELEQQEISLEVNGNLSIKGDIFINEPDTVINYERGLSFVGLARGRELSGKPVTFQTINSRVVNITEQLQVNGDSLIFGNTKFQSDINVGSMVSFYPYGNAETDKSFNQFHK